MAENREQNNANTAQQLWERLFSLSSLPYWAVLVGLMGMFFYAWQPPAFSPAIFASLIMIGIASSAIGVFVGFLFGIPRTKQAIENGDSDTEKTYTANTNLEDISDWLTKILVGVSLTQLTSVPGYLTQLGEYLKPILGDTPGGATFGVVTVIYFVSIGFLISYLQTRLRMEEALQLSDKRIKEMLTEGLKEGNANDAKLQNLVHELLNSRPEEINDIPPGEIEETFANASPTARQIAFSQAWDVRSDNWRDDKARMERTIPIFRALVKVDSGEKNHRYYGNLGWALKDKRNPTVPELTEAKKMLTEAIAIREDINKGYPQYELSRAIITIELDNSFKNQKASGKATQEAIMADLCKVIDYDPVWDDTINRIDTIQDWMKLNSLTLDNCNQTPDI